MDALLSQLIATLSPSALPLVVCILGLAWIYWKITTARKQTKTERDIAHEDLDKRLSLVEREIEEIKSLDLSAKLAQILTDLQWLKTRLKENDK